MFLLDSVRIKNGWSVWNNKCVDTTIVQNNVLIYIRTLHVSNMQRKERRREFRCMFLHNKWNSGEIFFHNFRSILQSWQWTFFVRISPGMQAKTAKQIHSWQDFGKLNVTYRILWNAYAKLLYVISMKYHL